MQQQKAWPELVRLSLSSFISSSISKPEPAAAAIYSLGLSLSSMGLNLVRVPRFYN
jgi:hypothetical protein